MPGGITASGEAAFLADLEALERRAANLRPALERVRDLIFDWAGTAFDTEGATTAAGSWAPLSEGYAAWKGEHSPGGILTLSGGLRESLTGGEGTRVEITETGLSIESELMVGPWFLGGLHETGAPNAGLPARSIDMPPELEARIGEELERFIGGAG